MTNRFAFRRPPTFYSPAKKTDLRQHPHRLKSN